MGNKISQPWFRRRLGFETLESRQMLSITVNTLVDENNGVGVGAGTSLREAIAAAAQGDTINFSVTGTINLSVGTSNTTKQLTINKNLAISGPGASLLTIKAFDPTPSTKNGDGSRVLTIDDGSATTLLNVSISGLTLTGGDINVGGGAIVSAENLVVSDCVISSNLAGISSLYDGGGAIFSKATISKPNSLTVRNSTLSGNTAPASEGGAIRQRYGTLVIENSTISNNSALNAGGGISASDGNVRVQISGSTFDTNKVTSTTGFGNGGAIFGVGATISVTGSTISNNTSYQGGGVFARSFSTVTITNCVLSTNTGSGSGGGVYTDSSALTVLNTTVSGNYGYGGGGISTHLAALTVRNSTISGNTAHIGAGIEAYSDSTSLTAPHTIIENSTITGNTASDDMGAIYVIRPALIRFCTITGNTTPANRNGAVASWGGGVGPITVQSSIIAGNTNGDLGYKNNPNPFTSLGYNLIGAGNNSTVANFNKVGDHTGVFNPMLAPLANNGGPTMTRAPLAGSLAIDAGDPAAVAGVGGLSLYDQRGNPYTRVWDGDGAGGARIDIGAVEVQTLPLPRAVYGDYNADGAVDGGDYVLWRKTMPATVTPYANADGSGNAVVGPEDYDVWRAHHGETVVAGSGTSVEVAGAEVESVAGEGEERVTTTPEAQDVPFVVYPVASAPVAPAAGAGVRVLNVAERSAAGPLRDDALVALVESASGVHKIGASAFDPAGHDSTDVGTDASTCIALDVAIGQLMSAAL
jgi:hypothetical protein